jgi:hypothetical protein
VRVDAEEAGLGNADKEEVSCVGVEPRRARQREMGLPVWRSRSEVGELKLDSGKAASG